jgi:ADP-ribose pyrophosphatase
MHYFFTCLLFFGALFSDIDEKQFTEYLEFLKQNPKLAKLGNYKDGEIEIVVEKKTVEKISKMQVKRFMAEGESKQEANDHSKIGIIAKDKYWIWIRDAVIFPAGATGTYDRLIKTSEVRKHPNNGVAFLPVTKEKKIVLLVIYRHALRDWSVEIPRGSVENSEPLLVAAEKKLRYETGIHTSELVYLGDIAPDSGTSAMIMPYYLAKVTSKGVNRPYYSEAVLGLIELSIDEVKNGLSKGYVDVELKGKKVKGLMKDSYLSYGLLLAEQKKLI